MKKLIKLLTLGSPILIMGCNNTGGSSNELTGGSLNTIQKNVLYFNTDTIDSGLLSENPERRTLFQEIDHQTNDAWDGISTVRFPDGHVELQVYSGRTGSKDTAQWLTSHDYLIGYLIFPFEATSTNTITRNNINFDELPDKYNFAIRGNFMFRYKPTNTEYVCNGIAITQYKSGWVSNSWAFFSNINPKYRASDSYQVDGSNHSIVMECLNKTSQTMEQFKVTAADGNKFDITKIENDGILTDKQLKLEVAASFNAMPIGTRLAEYSKSFDVTKYSPRNLTVSPSNRSNSLSLNENGSNISIILDGEVTVNNMGTTPIKSDTVLNCSNSIKEIHTSSFNNTLPSVVTTTTNHTLGGSLANLLPNNDGQFQIKINGHYVTNANFKYNKDTISNKYERSYNADSITVAVEPMSKRIVTATANHFSYSGKYKFIKPVTGTLQLSGYLFNNDSKHLPAQMYEDNNSAIVNIFDTLKYRDTFNFNPQIQLDIATGQVLLIGDGVYQGETIGEQYNYTIEDNIPLTDEEVKSLCGSAQDDEESPEEVL